ITFDDKARAEVAGKTFTLAKDANITIDGKSGTLAALPPGSLVDIRLWVDRQTVGQIHATGPAVPGIDTVRAVDAAKHTVTVGENTLPVARDANITIDGKGARLGKVPVGVPGAIGLNVDQKPVGATAHIKP